MGCNCRKTRTPVIQPAQQRTATPPPAQKDPATPAAPQRAGTRATQTFALVAADGALVATFGSRLEADAAWVRNGRRGTVSPL